MTARIDPELEHLKGTHVYKFVKQNGREEHQKGLILPTSLVLSADELRATEVTEPEMLIEKIQKHRSLSLTHSETGVGKTRVMMHKGIAVVQGSDFLCYQVPQPRRVLFVDGELPLEDLELMLRDFIGVETLPGLDFISSEMVYDHLGGSLNLASEKHQDVFLQLLDDLDSENRSPELIILDNIDTLFLDVDENSNTEQQSAINFLIHLRHCGFSVDLVHHSGLSGRQRGASRRKDQMDLIVKLEDARNNVMDGARFKWTLEKVRKKPEGSSTFNCEFKQNERTGLYYWHVEGIELKVHMAILRWCEANQPISSQKEIMEGCPDAPKSKSTMSNHIKTLQQKGFMTENFSVTKKGKQELARLAGAVPSKTDTNNVDLLNKKFNIRNRIKK